MFSFILSRFSTVGKRFTSLQREKEVNCLQNGASVGGYLTSAVQLASCVLYFTTELK